MNHSIKQLTELSESYRSELEGTGILIAMGDFLDETPDDSVCNHTMELDIQCLTYRCLCLSTDLRLGQRIREKALREDLQALFSGLSRLEKRSPLDRAAYLDSFCLMRWFCRPEDLPRLTALFPLSIRLALRLPVSPSDTLLSVMSALLPQLHQAAIAGEFRFVTRQMLGYLKEHEPERWRSVFPLLLDAVYQQDPALVLELVLPELSVYQELDPSDPAYQGFFWHCGWACSRAQRNTEAQAYYWICYQARCRLYGARSWPAVSVYIFRALCALAEPIPANQLAEPAEETIQNLHNLVRFLNSAPYDDIDLDTQLISAGNALTAILHYYNDVVQDLTGQEETLAQFQSCCERFNARPNLPNLKLSVYYNYLAAYHFQRGELIDAGIGFRQALDALPDDLDTTVDASDLIYNLCYISFVAGDIHNSFFFADLLKDALSDPEVSLTSMQRHRISVLLCSIAEVYVGYDAQTFAWVQRELREFYIQWEAAALSPDRLAVPPSERCGYALHFLAMVEYAVILGSVSPELAERYYAIARIIEQHSGEFNLLPTHRYSLTTVLGILAWKLNKPEALDYVNTLLNTSARQWIPSSVQNSHHLVSYLVLEEHGLEVRGLSMIQHGMDQLTEEWHGSIRFLDDHLLVSVLIRSQELFSVYYAILRHKVSAEQSYRFLLQFKALADLAARERNRVLRNHKDIDQEACRSIRALQDRYAQLCVQSQFSDVSDELLCVQDELEHREALFFSQFPAVNDFTEITLERVFSAMPEHSAVAEFFLCSKEYSVPRMEVSQPREMVFDLYVIVKQNGAVSLHRFVIPHADALVEDAKAWVRLLQEEDPEGDEQRTERLELLRRRLYHALFDDVLPLMDGVQQLYFAPDLAINDLPAEQLGENEHDTLSARFRLSHIVSARDFLFFFQGDPRCGSLVLGDPVYHTQTRLPADKPEAERNRQLLSSLPFSREEARRVSSRLGSTPVTGMEATKYVLQNAGSRRVIHLATHGGFDETGCSDTLFTACLYFAGAGNDPAEPSDSRLGNGILTADEISRMDLHGVELVVLSACCSGRSDSFYTNCAQGLVSSFLSAGAQYVITSLWNVSDFATAVLMDKFYQEYCAGAPAPAALHRAKVHLRNLSLGELRKDGWLSPLPETEENASANQYLARLRRISRDSYQPFRSEAYWGGFICHGKEDPGH